MQISIYIDGNNLYRAAKEFGFDLDYKRFAIWLRQKYRADPIYLFVGYIPKRVKFYEFLDECGYTLIFKTVISVLGTIKGNCDAELVLKVVSDFYTKSYDRCIISGDGDFACLVEFLSENFALGGIIAPNKYKCSFLLRKKKVSILFLNKNYYKFAAKFDKAPYS